ncbi:hypothetical protein RI129_011597 [Pyrocoelia pectoralis]|uniref:Sequestosome-1 n=1 Tax=Pyrocoelia pectoralis TaxID=417401 RepID=A0AAN7UWQ7_9COLE
MSDGNIMNLKIFLKADNTVEVRRVTVDASVATSFLFMKEKLQTVFPILRNSAFKITWKDVDDDEITIASDEDFITAFTEMNGNLKILTVKVSQQSPEAGIYVCSAPQEPRKPMIICDACDQKITGFRYKCLQCPDFDLCASCEFHGCHSNHVMVRLPNNETYSPRCAQKFMHHITRNLKKSAHCASKEAHRAAKHASKYASKCRQNDSSAEEDNQPQACPLTAEDAHELGSWAHQRVSEIFKPIPSSEDQCRAENPGLVLIDVLRNVVDGFFGKPATQSQTENVTQPQTESATKPTSDNQSAPMETETSSSAPIYPILDQDIPNSTPTGSGSQSMATAGTVTPPENNQNPEWTFVASNNQTDINTNVTPQNDPARVAFIYHENPVIAEGLVKLHEMGFSNETGVLSNLLEHFNGNVNNVVKAIFDRNI